MIKRLRTLGGVREGRLCLQPGASCTPWPHGAAVRQEWVFQAGEGLLGTGKPTLRVGRLQGIRWEISSRQVETRACGLRARSGLGCCDHSPGGPDSHTDGQDVQVRGLHTSAGPLPVAEPATEDAETARADVHHVSGTYAPLVL